MPKWLLFLTHPLFWEVVLCLSVIAILVVALIRKILGGVPQMNFGRREPVGAEPAAPPSPPPPEPVAPVTRTITITKKQKKGVAWTLGIIAALVALVFVIEAGLPLLKISHGSLLAWVDMVKGHPAPAVPVAHLPSGEAVGLPACTEPKHTVQATSAPDEYVWVTNPSGCQIATEPGLETSLFDLKCKDLQGNEHDWSELDDDGNRLCEKYQALGFHKHADASDTTPLTITVSFNAVAKR